MDDYWLSQFRARMAQFAKVGKPGHTAVSIKVRVQGGCFHREHSPAAYQEIDRHIARADLSGVQYVFEEHETGPEVLLWVAATTTGILFLKSVVELITAIIKARSEGRKKGDHPSEPIELIVRGLKKDGEYFEEKILRVNTGDPISAALLAEALATNGIQVGRASGMMTLKDAAQKFPVEGLDMDSLAKQEEAFEVCVSFLEGVEKTKNPNTRHTSYGLKHMVERSSSSGYAGYIYEGTLILAALASGFQMRQRGKTLAATFNMSERSLKKRERELSKE